MRYKHESCTVYSVMILIFRKVIMALTLTLTMKFLPISLSKRGKN